MPRYKATKFSLNVPRLDDKGRISKTSNVLVVGGRTAELTEDEAAPFVQAGQLERVQEAAAAPQQSGESAGPDGGQYPHRPAKAAGLDKWQEAAAARGLETGGTKAELQTRVEEFDAARRLDAGDGKTQ